MVNFPSKIDSPKKRQNVVLLQVVYMERSTFESVKFDNTGRSINERLRFQHPTSHVLKINILCLVHENFDVWKKVLIYMASEISVKADS